MVEMRQSCVCMNARKEECLNKFKAEKCGLVMERTEGKGLFVFLLGSYSLPWGDCHTWKGLFMCSWIPLRILFVLWATETP